MSTKPRPVSGIALHEFYSLALISDSTYRTCYIAVPLFVCGFLVLGASFQKHLSVGALVMGWGISEVAVMINTVAVCTSLVTSRLSSGSDADAPLL